MALRQMPNGQYIDVADDITPEGMQSLMTRFKATGAARSPGVPEAPRVSRRDAEDTVYRDTKVKDLKTGLYSDDGVVGHAARAADSLAHAGSFGLIDVAESGIDAATSGVVEAVKKRDIGEIKRRYTNNREALKAYRRDLADEHPLDDLGGTIVGVVKNPLGAETGVARASNAIGNAVAKVGPRSAEGVRRVREAAGIIKSAKPVQTFGKAANSTIGVGARAGFNQGAATALVDGKSPEDVLNEGGQGALFGAGAGLAVRGGKAAYNIVKNRTPEAAGRVAYGRVAEILNKSEDVATGKPFTANSARQEIEATRRGGSEATLGDLTPETQALQASLVRRGAGGASSVANRAEGRASAALDRFDARVRKVLGIDKDADDAFTHGEKLVTERKAAGKRDYSDDVMDKQLAWSDELEDIFKGGNPAITDALPGAEKLARIDGKDITQNVLHPDFGIKPDAPVFMQKPSMGVMQYMTQSLDGLVGKAIRAGDDNLARAYSKVNRQLKDAVGAVNPELKSANALQRDFFERSQSVELGASIIKALQSNNSRQVMAQINAAGTHADDLKIAFADALQHMREAGDPVRLMRRIMRSDDQRAVLTRLFDGPHNLNEFERFMRRETRAARSDKMIGTAHGAPNVGPDADGGEALVDAGLGIARGGVFGPLSAASALSRAGKEAKKLSKSLSPVAQAELLKVLQGGGEGLKRGINRSEAYKRIQARKVRKAAIAAGKAPGAVVGGYSEQ